LQTPVAQGVPEASGGLLGVPAVHTFCVHSKASTGRSEFRGTISTLPAPSHWLTLQSPGVWVATGVLSGV